MIFPLFYFHFYLALQKFSVCSKCKEINFSFERTAVILQLPLRIGLTISSRRKIPLSGISLGNKNVSKHQNSSQATANAWLSTRMTGGCAEELRKLVMSLKRCLAATWSLHTQSPAHTGLSGSLVCQYVDQLVLLYHLLHFTLCSP